MDKTNQVAVKAGTVVDGTYKRPGRAATKMALEVSAVMEIPGSRGSATYLFGVRTDEANAGRVVAVRANAFDPRRTTVGKAPKSFKPLDLANWYTTTGSDSFAFVEELTDEADRAWAESQGGLRLADLAKDEATVTVL